MDFIEDDVTWSQGASLPPLQLTDSERSDLIQNLAALPQLQSPNSIISEPLNPYNQKEKTENKRKNKINFGSDHGSNSDSNESPRPPGWAPLQLSPLVGGELEGHISQKVYTLNEQKVPLLVKKSWDMLSHFMDVQGVPEPEIPKTHLPTPIPQRAVQNTKQFQDLPSFHLHVNTGMNAKLNRTEDKRSQSLTSSDQFKSVDDPQILRYKPLVVSTGTPPPRGLGVNIIQEETTLLKKDPKHVLELSIEQRVTGLPEKRIQPHKMQVTNVELTPKIPCLATESIKPPNPVKTMSVTPIPPDQVTESMQVTQNQAIESTTITSSLNQVTDNMKSLLEKGPRSMSQTSVAKNYIQRHILCHGLEKRLPLRMWTRGSPSSIIQQYSGTRLGIKKTNSKITDVVQTISQNMPVMPLSYSGVQIPTLVKSESALRIFYNREDTIPVEENKNSQSDSQTRIFESQHSLKSTYPSKVKADFSEQFHMLKDLQLKIAAKLLRSQIPHNVPPPLGSGLVLKYPICLQCGRCSGFNCCHKSQSTLGSYLLIYPQLHLSSTPEGQGELRLHLGFRLRMGKKVTVSPSQRKAKIYNSVSKNPPPSRYFQSGSSQSPPSAQVHIRQKHGVVGKREIKESGHYEFCQVHPLSESGFERNRDDRWAKVRIKKSSDLKYPMKRVTKGLRTQNTKLSKDSTGELPDPLRRKNIEITQTSTASSKRQPKKSSQPRFMQLLFQGLRQAFQSAYRMVAATGQKSKPDNLLSSRNYHPNPKVKDYHLPGNSNLPAPTTKQEDLLQGTSDKCRKAQQPKRASASQPRVLQVPETIVSETDITIQTTSSLQPLSVVQNVHRRTVKNFCSDEISGLEPKNILKPGAKFQAQERILPGSLLEKTLHFTDGHTHKEGNQHSLYRGESPLHPTF
ncbi:uncharacterized protein C2orf16-like [Nannospalax galili]|uniref:uncharacterized protein C2orf16-like n=1 Tax=Nannospalax galili TaxID=1026970 RepID=UPI00081A0563|nr:uncharacterized protein C2orf16-like [Nannospalax galili]